MNWLFKVLTKFIAVILKSIASGHSARGPDFLLCQQFGLAFQPFVDFFILYSCAIKLRTDILNVADRFHQIVPMYLMVLQ